MGGENRIRDFAQCTNEETGSLQDVSVLAEHRYCSGAGWMASNEAITGSSHFSWVSYLHYPVPVVSRGYSEESQKGHPKVSEGGVPSQPLTGVRVVALCGTKHSLETPAHPPLPPLPLARDRGRLTKVSKQLHSKSCKYEKQQHEEKTQIPHLEREKEMGGKKNTKKEHSLIFLFQTCFLLYSLIQNLNCFRGKMTSM